MSQRGWDWTGLTDRAAPGAVFEAEVGAPGGEPALHRQRHWPQGSVESAMNSSGLKCIAVLGQRGEGDQITLDISPDEERHYKLIYIGSPYVG
jgi:hypothetical protein